ncbi:Protein-export protein SecB (maintains pre-export unfolded state) [hydrothermal vent metagenome]|uniref:Protein-export protein SecB (Maintains pre-export unfolded state) n=1 Tax=hydrothermal vent metagenome TaxID=652676 RepID=A0A3B0X0S4_9ZZZZ
MSETAQHVFLIQKIYTKDISFESPNTPEIFSSEFQPQLSIDLNVDTKKLGSDMYHVVVRVTATTKVDEKVAFLCEVEQAGVFTISGFTEEEMGYMLAVQGPGILFPYAREVVSDLVTRGGFPQLLLEPVNFELMYHEHLQKADANGEKPTEQ